MSKSLFIAEKPGVAREFARTLKEKMTPKGGFMESDSYVVTWCVGHLVAMSYPDSYDEKYRKWSLDDLPFIPDEFKYEVIDTVRGQFETVKKLLNREDIGIIYVCTDSGREGEYIYRLVAMMAGLKDKVQKRVWLDSQTEEEILRGIREAKDLSEYDNLAAAAYMRAKEDYLMGINFSRALSLKYGYSVGRCLNGKYKGISVGRVMTCVLGMAVRREREIRNFRKTAFYRIFAVLNVNGSEIAFEWKPDEKSRYSDSHKLYEKGGFLKKEDAENFLRELEREKCQKAVVSLISEKKENKNPPLLFNLAELQNECSGKFKISPDQTLNVLQELYEKKLVTYPRTDARVLSSAVAKEIYKNIKGLAGFAPLSVYASNIIENGSYKGIAKSRYTNDSKITDHYAIIPTGTGLGSIGSLSKLSADVYELISRRFLSVFYPAAVFRKVSASVRIGSETFASAFKILIDEGYMKVSNRRYSLNKEGGKQNDAIKLNSVSSVKKGDKLEISGYNIREGETSPPKRYTSGTIILAMENAGQLIEDEELRVQIKTTGIGTSATRAEILGKLVNISYLSLNKKTQVITPTQLGEIITDVVALSVRALLNPELTASWEKGLELVSRGEITSEEYMKKLKDFIIKKTENIISENNRTAILKCFERSQKYYLKRTL